VSARRLAWGLWWLAFALTPAGLLFSHLNRSLDLPGPSGFAFDVTITVASFAWPTIGVLVATRRPGNAIGWIFLAVGVPLAISNVANGWGAYALITKPGALPAGAIMAWISSWIFFPSLLLAGPLVFLLFPDGHLPSRRWRPLAVWVVVAVALITLGAALMPGHFVDAPFKHVDNPFGVGTRGLFSAIQGVGFTVVLAIPVCVAALLLRFRRARGEQRLQLKWFVFTAAAFAALLVAGAVLHRYAIGQLLILVGFTLIPLGAGVGILKYRLYDVDVVINRTLVYGSLTATLAAVYVGSVLLLQLALDSVTSNSSLAVAVSTLGVAALFRPARARIQAVVDRRFYRRKYDAARTLEQFSARLREQVDLEALGGELRGVVAETMQPAHVSLWLRAGGR
jgi:hypothetical protein